MADKIKGITIELGADTTKLKSGVKEAGAEVESAGSKFSEFATTAGAAIATAVAAASAAIVALGKDVVSAVGETAEYGDNIDKMSQKLGISAEAYQEWDAIAQHSGTSMESLKTSFKTLANAADDGKDAFERLGMNLEDVKSMSTEDLFEATIAALQNMEEGTERTAIASDLLGKGATELGALLNTSAEDTEKMRQTVHELGGVMSDEAVKDAARYQDSLQDLNTSISGLKRGITSEFMPAIADVMDGLTLLFSGQEGGAELIRQGIEGVVTTINESIPQFLGTVVQLIGNLAETITASLPILIEAINGIIPQLVDVVTSVAGVILENLPLILSAGVELLKSLIEGIVSAIPDLIESALDIITELAEYIIEIAPELIESGIELIVRLVEGIYNNLPKLIETAIDLVKRVCSTLLSKFPDIMQKGRELLINIVNGIVEKLPELINTALSLVANLCSTIAEKLPDVLEKGREILLKVVSGITDKLPDLIRTAIQLVTEIVKAIGEHLPEILASGIKIISELIVGLIQAIPDIIAAIPEIISAIVDTFGEYDWLEIGRNIMEGLKNGLLNTVENVKQAVLNVCGSIGDAFKDFFGIESPSKWMRDEIGGNMMKGLDAGLDKYSVLALEEAQNISDSLAAAFNNGIGGFNAMQAPMTSTANLTMTTPVYLDGRVIASVVNQQLGVLL